MKLNTILLIAIFAVVSYYVFRPIPVEESLTPTSNEPVKKTTLAEEITTVIKRRIIPTGPIVAKRIIPNNSNVELDQFTGQINWKGR